MRINRTLGLALTAAVLAVAMTGCSNSASSTASSTASSAASSEAASSVAASSEAAESETAAASVVSTEDLDVNGTTYSAVEGERRLRRPERSAHEGHGRGVPHRGRGRADLCC